MSILLTDKKPKMTLRLMLDDGDVLDVPLLDMHFHAVNPEWMPKVKEEFRSPDDLLSPPEEPSMTFQVEMTKKGRKMLRQYFRKIEKKKKS